MNGPLYSNTSSFQLFQDASDDFIAYGTWNIAPNRWKIKINTSNDDKNEDEKVNVNIPQVASAHHGKLWRPRRLLGPHQ